MSWFEREPKEFQEIKIYGDYHPGGSKDTPFVVCFSHLCLIKEIQVINFVHNI